MAIVPEGKEIYIGNKKFKAGDQLPASYNVTEKKAVKKPVIKEEK